MPKAKLGGQGGSQRFRMSAAQRMFLLSLIADGLDLGAIQAACERFPEPWTPTEQAVQYWRHKQQLNRREVIERQNEGALVTGLAKAEKRVEKLVIMAELLEQDIIDRKRMWMDKTRHIFQGNTVTEEQFIEPLMKQYRGILDDIAKEVGGRDPRALNIAALESTVFRIPADMLAPEFVAVNRDITDRNNLEYLFRGGRGSTKSTYIGEKIIELVKNNPQGHALITRQVGNTLRDSVFAQVRWAITEMGLDDQFKSTTSPLEIEYIPTGQKIYFRGGDDPVKIKSIKPPFGYIMILWFEELDQFKGPEAVRNIEQSAIRGGDTAWIFKSFNPPRSVNNWANKYAAMKKPNRYDHFSNYLGLPEGYLAELAKRVMNGSSLSGLTEFDEMVRWSTSRAVPHQWLGKPWLDEATFLREMNMKSYLHEYGGIAVGLGGLVFDNVIQRPITAKEIASFGAPADGIDWGYFPDPFVWGRSYLDAARMNLYIYDELVLRKTSNELAYKQMVNERGYNPSVLIIADSAEPKSIADFKSYGANIRGAMKGAESVTYSMKWLQSLNSIIVDPERAPLHAEEFVNYELEQDKNGDFISAYPDKNNHTIDRTRYAHNMVWMRRGQ